MVLSQYEGKTPDWVQPYEMIKRKVETNYNRQQIAIEEMQNRIVTLENTIEDLMEGNTVEAALDRRWDALGEE